MWHAIEVAEVAIGIGLGAILLIGAVGTLLVFALWMKSGSH